jgi:hypothetical protein
MTSKELKDFIEKMIVRVNGDEMTHAEALQAIALLIDRTPLKK